MNKSKSPIFPIFLLSLLILTPSLFRGSELPRTAGPLRPVATYSIVAIDPDSGQMGVAVQSHWFSVGSIVTWAEAGIEKNRKGGREK